MADTKHTKEPQEFNPKNSKKKRMGVYEKFNTKDPTTRKIEVGGKNSYIEREVEGINSKNEIIREHFDMSVKSMENYVAKHGYRYAIKKKNGERGWVKFPRVDINKIVKKLDEINSGHFLMKQLDRITYNYFGLRSDLDEIKEIGNMFVGEERTREIKDYIHGKMLKESKGGPDTFSGIEARKDLLLGQDDLGNKEYEQKWDNLDEMEIKLLKMGNSYKPINKLDAIAFTRARFKLLEKIQDFSEKILNGEKSEIEDDPTYKLVKEDIYLNGVLEEFIKGDSLTDLIDQVQKRVKRASDQAESTD